MKKVFFSFSKKLVKNHLDHILKKTDTMARNTTHFSDENAEKCGPSFMPRLVGIDASLVHLDKPVYKFYIEPYFIEAVVSIESNNGDLKWGSYIYGTF